MQTFTSGAPSRANDAHAEIARLHQVVTVLEQQLDATRAEHRRACEQLVAANQGSSDMLKLSVALCRLYESDDRDSALAGVREIVINVIGSESFAVFTLDGPAGRLQPLTSMGLADDAIAWHVAAKGVVGEVARTGQRYIGAVRRSDVGLPESPELVACVPLRLGRRVEGVLAIHALLAHKPALEAFDLDILDLLSTHAMSAIRAASLRAGPAAA
jgi:GAF domain-containing protein